MGQYDRLESRLLELERAVSRLEGKEELLIEKAKNAALEKTVESFNGIADKVYGIQSRIERLESKSSASNMITD